MDRRSTAVRTYIPNALVRYFPAFIGLNARPVVGDLYYGFFMWEAPVVAKGRFIFIERGSDWWFSETVSNGDVGVPIPTPRERDALTGKSVIFPVPVNPILVQSSDPFYYYLRLDGWRERNTLRVYAWDSTGNLEVKVRWRGFFFEGQYAFDEVVIPVNRRDFDHISYPYYAEVDLQTLFAKYYCWFSMPHEQCQAYDGIVEVEPTTPGARYYAFVSSTDNATNRIAIYGPR